MPQMSSDNSWEKVDSGKIIAWWIYRKLSEYINMHIYLFFYGSIKKIYILHKKSLASMFTFTMTGRHYAFSAILTHFECFHIFFRIYLHRTLQLRPLKWSLKSRVGEMPVFSKQKVLQTLNLNFNLIYC